MLKSLTFSVSLAFALGAASVSMAGGHGGGCTTCGIASPQGAVVASPQYETCDTCAPKKKHCFTMPKFHMPKMQHTYTYEYVLKKKHSWSWAKGCGSGCGETYAPAVYPTSQVAPSGQGTWAAPQATPVPPASKQSSLSLPGEMKPALAADEVPPAPTIANGGSSLLQLTPSGN
jgi:hypothetical protein